MTAVTIYGAKGRGLRELVPPQFALARFYRGNVQQIVDKAIFANGAGDIGAKCYLGEVPSHAVINPASAIYNGAFGTGAKLNIGDANDDDALATIIDVAAGGNSP